MALLSWGMQIIPVLDVAAGIAVHARAGHRAHYGPVESILAPEASGDALALQRAYYDRLALHDCYVADLDAIQGGAPQRALLRQLADFQRRAGGMLLIDAGTTTADAALDLVADGAGQIVVGLETLRAWHDLGRVVDAVGSDRTIFGLDLRMDIPVVHPASPSADARPTPATLAARAVARGVSAVLVIDVGRVGTGCGVNLDLLEALRRQMPGVRLLAGGGLQAHHDLDRLRDVGCDGVVVASALHDGRLTAEHLRR